MNTFRKVADAWCVMSAAQREPGTVVTVTLKDGRTKTVQVGAQVGTYQGHYLYAVESAKKPETTSTQVGDLSGVLALFAKAKQHLKFPAVVLSVPGTGLTIRLSVAGPRAKVPGSITVLDAVKGIEGRDWFGRITVDGNYQPSRALECDRADAAVKVVERLREFACDPVKVAAEHGKLTGVCCFCNAALGKGEDKRSTEVGYGPVCAKNYGLPWGVKDKLDQTIEGNSSVRTMDRKLPDHGDWAEANAAPKKPHEPIQFSLSYGSFRIGGFNV